MACLSNYTLTGIGLDCNANLAGIKRIWLGYNDVFTATPDAATHTITTLAGAEATDKLYQYDFARTTGSLTSTLTKDEANGTRYYTNEIVLQFNKMEASKHLEVQAMAAEALIAIVEDNNGEYWYVGLDSYVSASATTAQSGQSFDDLNGYQITLSAMSAELPYKIAKATFESLIDDGE